MSLPYPHEVETGALRPRPVTPRTTLDVEAQLQDAIRISGSQIEVFGVPLQVPPHESADAIAEPLRRAVATHFEQRFSAPDLAIWESFASQARAQLEGRTQLDASTLNILRITIDAL